MYASVQSKAGIGEGRHAAKRRSQQAVRCVSEPLLPPGNPVARGREVSGLQESSETDDGLEARRRRRERRATDQQIEAAQRLNLEVRGDPSSTHRGLQDHIAGGQIMNIKLTPIVCRRLQRPILDQDRHESGHVRMSCSVNFPGNRFFRITGDVQMDRQFAAHQRNTSCFGRAAGFLIVGHGGLRAVVHDTRADDRRGVEGAVCEKRQD